MAENETGWTNDLVSKEAVNKILYDGYQAHLHHCTNSVNAAQFVHGLQKAVTDLPSPEQLTRLREAAKSAMDWMSWWVESEGADIPDGVPSTPDILAALREALAPRQEGEQS